MESESTLNTAAQDVIRSNWNAFAPAYDQCMHLYMLQAFTTLTVHAAAHTRRRILEVACGSGLHSTYLAKTML